MGNKSKNKDYLVQGTILVAASFIARIIGMVYRIPLKNILGTEGIGYYSTANELYNIILMVSSFSIPLAVSRMVSERLHADPNRDRINYVPVTGFPFGNGLELYIPLGKKDFDALKYDRLSQKLYIEFCCRVIDIFLRHFPDMPLGIAYTDWFGADAEGNRRDLTESTAILGYAVAQAKKNGAVVVPMGLWLGWDGICNNPDHPMMRLFAKSARAAGFGAWEGQMGSCERKCLPLAEQIELARRNRVDWVQFWHHDCICAECVKTLGAYRKAVAR